MLNFYYDIPSYERELAPLVDLPDKMPVALQRSLGKLLTKLKTEFVRGVSSETVLPQKHVRAGLYQSRVTWEGDGAQGYLGGTKGRQLLFRYKVKPSGPSVRRPPVGASAQVLRSSGLGVIPGSFLAQLSSGHIGVFRRKDGSRRIKELTGPSVQFFFHRDSIRIPIEDQSDELFAKFLAHEVEFLLQQAG